MPPFDPSLPPNQVQVRAEELRNQFNGLKELIDAVPTLNAAQVNATHTLSPGASAEASVGVNGNTLEFTFAIPQGPGGPQGSQGEVSQSVLDAAITGTSNNSNSVATLDTIFPDLAMEEMRAKLNELINALRR